MILQHKATPLITPRVTDADFAAMVRIWRGDVFRITARLSAELITPDDWADYFDAILTRGHTASSVLGRHLAGDMWPESGDDQIMGLAAKDADAEFLANFLDDLKGDRYFNEDGSLKVNSVMNRAQLYLGKFRATAADAFVLAGELEDEYDWDLGANDHCGDCPRIAALSPFTQDTLFTRPGEGDTECLGNCTCRLKRNRDGIQTFGRVDLRVAA